ncbi:MAG: PAS domain S-box protein [Nitrospirae bacterium]|nr:PAS domain S-box protein [Nitrospirota bacterium]
MSSSEKKQPQPADDIPALRRRVAELEAALLTDERVHTSMQNAEEEKNRIEAILNAIGDPVSVQDTSFRVLYQNEAHKKLVGAHPGELCYQAYVNRDTTCDKCPVALSFMDGNTHTAEKPGAPEKGILSVEITASALKDAQGRIIAGIEVVRDLTSRRKTEEALHHAEEKFRSLVEHSLVGIYIFQNGIFPYVNPKAADVFGYTQEEIASLPLSGLIVEEDLGTAERNIQSLLSGEASISHAFLRGKRKDGTIIELETEGTKTEIDGKPAIIGTLLDVTERRRMEEEIRKSQKLESLSAFAGGIAHEYNNILTAIIGNLALAKMYAKPGFEVYDVLLEAEKASLRAKDLTSQLLSFATGGIQVRKVVSIQELLRDLVRLSADARNISCELALPDGLWTIEVDEGQVSQAVDTLLRYAQQVTPQDGRITISAENTIIGHSSALPLREGRYVMIAIEDQGRGIPEAELQTLFDPFSAADKEGSGLEFASAFAIVQKHHGHITAESHFGAGTTFRLFLPAMQEKPQAAAEAFTVHPLRKGKILVMDDEEIVRVVVERLLLQCGFEAELTTDGVEMLRHYRKAKEAGMPFEAVILDLVIQNGMGGQEAMKNLLEYDPEVRVIVSSGYSNDPIMANFRDYGFSGFLPKPYKLDELKRAIKDITSYK